MNQKPDIKRLDIAGLRNLALRYEQQPFRGNQLAQWLYRHGAVDFSRMNNLPLILRKALTKNFSFAAPELVERRVGADKTRKYLVRLADGELVETVSIQSENRLTVCLSTQVGCPMNCAFCATGEMGLHRSLLAGEMLDQLAVVQRDLEATLLDPAQAPDLCKSAASGFRRNDDYGSQAAPEPRNDNGVSRLLNEVAPGSSGLTAVALRGKSAKRPASAAKVRISNVVVMGQGEPFANYDATLAALRMINDPELYGIGARHITVSTCGLVPQLRRFAAEPEQFTLAVSLHSAVQATRNTLMPNLTDQSLVSLREALIFYLRNTSRRPSLEYALVEGVNDSAAELRALIEFCAVPAPGFHVNLLRLNPTTPTLPKQDAQNPTLTCASLSALRSFEKSLLEAGISVSLRKPRGTEVGGACGQLASQARP